MSAAEWKPGDVAMLTSNGVDNLALRTIYGWVVPAASGYRDTNQGFDAARRLVVLDPESDEDVRRLCEAYKSVDHGVGTRPMQAALRELANATPPRIDEPGVWGVVEASCVHSEERLHWMRGEDDNWWPFIEYSRPDRRPLPDDWDSLIDPVLVREGVPE